MPVKYKIETAPAAPRHRPVGKLGIVDWREDCSACHNCVKKGCIYDVYRQESQALHDELGYLDYIYQCKGCLNCVQNCTKNLLTRVVNPEFNRLGDGFFTPEIILTTWFQAATGQVPVSGAGYGGPFSGPGFDSMWTDMSEIVRPTRDGIHGREYISTSVDLGRKLSYLAFDGMALKVSPPTIVEIPIPLIFETIPPNWQRGAVIPSVINAAARLSTLAILPAAVMGQRIDAPAESVIPLLTEADPDQLCGLPQTGLFMMPDSPGVVAAIAKIKVRYPERVSMVRLAASKDAARRAVQLSETGAEVIHLVFDPHGMEQTGDRPRHMRDVIREVHGALVEAGTRDEITLSVSGGIALAEHMAKAIICGADLVAVDRPLIIALECQLCLECTQEAPCPIALETTKREYAVQRMVNLVGSWHSQLLEVMGAMGIREVRRLRGETGRCMFFEDLEADTFGRLFGRRKAEADAR